MNAIQKIETDVFLISLTESGKLINREMLRVGIVPVNMEVVGWFLYDQSGTLFYR
jgi:hypothetical protein